MLGNFNKGDYYLLVQSYYSESFLSNLLVNVTQNNPYCRDITHDLNFCANSSFPAKTGALFQLTAQQVLQVEQEAIYDFQQLIAVWPKCNQTIVDFVCQINFQYGIGICNNGNYGNGLCADDCLSILNSQCGDRTLCGESVCLAVTECYTTGGSSGLSAGLGLWVSLVVGLVGVAWF